MVQEMQESAESRVSRSLAHERETREWALAEQQKCTQMIHEIRTREAEEANAALQRVQAADMAAEARLRQMSVELEEYRKQSAEKIMQERENAVEVVQRSDARLVEMRVQMDDLSVRAEE